MAQLTKKNIRGALIVEILVAFGLASVLIPIIVLGFISGTRGQVQQEQRVKASALLREAEEAVRSVRNENWSNIATNGVYHPEINGTAWTLSGGSEVLGDFTRTVTIQDFTPADISKKLVTVSVSWENLFPVSVTSDIVLTRWKNLTSELDVSGVLLNQGSGDWCSPSLSLAELDLPKNGVANAVSAIQGQLAAGTGDNASGVSYANVVITDPAAPAAPVPVIEGTFDGFKTNDVFTEQDYAYLATDTNSKEVVIVNLNSISAGKYAEAGYFNAPGNGNATAVATSGNVGYMVDGDDLYNFNLTSKTGSRPGIDTTALVLPGSATRMAIFGNRAYITTTSTSSQLVIVDITNSSNLSILRAIALPAQEGRAVYINSTGTRAYVATGASSTQDEMFIVNIDETSPNFGNRISSYNTNGMNPKGIVLVNLPKVVIVGTGAEEYQVVDVTNETSLTRCGGLNIDSGVNGVSTVYTAAQRAYSYIITGDATTELKIIEGGPGGGGSGGGLTVESESLEVAPGTIFNRIDMISKSPSTVSVTFQVAVSTDCQTFNFVGSIGEEGGQIPTEINPGRCFRYRAIFSGGTGISNVSTNVRINYSP
jgi:type II secretory pathway pseudopilin PulG